MLISEVGFLIFQFSNVELCYKPSSELITFIKNESSKRLEGESQVKFKAKAQDYLRMVTQGFKEPGLSIQTEHASRFKKRPGSLSSISIENSGKSKHTI